MQKILITGSSGYIGSSLCVFLEKKYIIKGLDKNSSNYFKFTRINLLNIQKLNQVLKSFKPDIVVHLAAQSLVDETVNKKNVLESGVIYRKDIQDEGTWVGYQNNRVTRTYKDGRIFEIGFLDGSNGNGFTKYTDEYFTIKASFKDGFIKRSKKTNYINEFSYDTYGERKLRKMKSKNGFYNLHSYFTESIKQDLGIIEPIEINRYGVYLSDLEKNIGRVVWNTITLESKEIPQADFYTYNSDKDWDMEFKNYTYIGDFLGYGVEEWKEGSVYKGYFKGGTLLRAGYGELIYDDNDERASYAGIWWDNKKNGYGVLTYKNGKVEKGIFRNNEFFKKADFDLQFMQILLKDF